LRGGPVWRPSRVGWPSRTCARCPEGSVAHTRLNAGSWPFPLPALTLAVLLSQRAGLCGSSSRRVRGWARRVAPRGLRLSLEDTSAPCCLRPGSWRAESPAPTEAGTRSDARSGDARSSDSSHGVRLKDAPPSTSAVCVRSQLAAVPDWRGVLRTGHAVRWACAPRSAAASLRAFGPGQPDRDTFRPCRFSRLRRLAPHTRRRFVAPCSRSWGSPGCGWARVGREATASSRLRPSHALRLRSSIAGGAVPSCSIAGALTERAACSSSGQGFRSARRPTSRPMCTRFHEVRRRVLPRCGHPSKRFPRSQQGWFRLQRCVVTCVPVPRCAPCRPLPSRHFQRRRVSVGAGACRGRCLSVSSFDAAPCPQGLDP
jgi:hypothetical protein